MFRVQEARHFLFEKTEELALSSASSWEFTAAAIQLRLSETHPDRIPIERLFARGGERHRDDSV